ncbi:neuropilin-1-like [Lytechinus variegatus]|uniref:neuropilin-1-like n=1 Tax=Lytechinus variegatus TaxID=7654 RepID=UPI001BB1B975|nr:neuropilin-1-like [Lytechinus variegatus]
MVAEKLIRHCFDMAEELKRLIIWEQPSTNDLLTMINRVRRVRLKSYFLYLFCTWITYIVTSTTATMETVTNPTLDCTNRPQITSPGYPSRYENNIFIKWYIDTPRDKRILVTFNYFSLDSDDFMYATDGFAKKKYTGENMQYPPYLATGLTLQIEFASSPRGRRKGFNVSVACHEPPSKYGG